MISRSASYLGVIGKREMDWIFFIMVGYLGGTLVMGIIESLGCTIEYG